MDEYLINKMLCEYIMYYESDYTFNKQTRIGGDSCDMSQKNVQDTNAVNYMLTNFQQTCAENKTIEIATRQPAINFTGSHKIGLGGCNVDESSLLSITELTRNKDKISLSQRPYLTVPYLGRGKSNAMMESQIQQSEMGNNRKSINPSSEVSHLNYRQTPLIASIQTSITNPANLIEGVADKGWIRGGIPARQLTRDKEYTNSKQIT